MTRFIQKEHPYGLRVAVACCIPAVVALLGFSGPHEPVAPATTQSIVQSEESRPQVLQPDLLEGAWTVVWGTSPADKHRSTFRIVSAGQQLSVVTAADMNDFLPLQGSRRTISVHVDGMSVSFVGGSAGTVKGDYVGGVLRGTTDRGAQWIAVRSPREVQEHHHKSRIPDHLTPSLETRDQNR
ncbi:hypothetical protein [Terriglobus albidus]|uniref:hypothetical protein n=1 Tax=Terriglobus albidus TaxID=1592106 RepID=UPI0021E09FBB|nr:hypothetical protein [Terriglobus albidus]